MPRVRIMGDGVVSGREYEDIRVMGACRVKLVEYMERLVLDDNSVVKRSIEI